MTRIKLKLTAFALVAMVIGCTPIYVPNVVNIPLNSNKGDVTAGLYTGTCGYDLQFNYAVSDHIAVMLNGSYGKNSPENDSLPNDYYKHVFGEAGAGYFTKFGSTGRFEAYGGMGTGYGTANNNYLFIGAQSVYATGYYNRLFAQVNIANVTEFVDEGFCLRATYVNFFKYTYSSTDYKHSNDQIFIEPVGFARFGWRYVKFESQIGFAIPVGNKSFDDYQPFIFNFGLVFNINAFGNNWWEKQF